MAKTCITTDPECAAVPLMDDNCFNGCTIICSSTPTSCFDIPHSVDSFTFEAYFIFFFTYLLGSDFTDAQVFSFSKKTSFVKICFRRGCFVVFFHQYYYFFSVMFFSKTLQAFSLNFQILLLTKFVRKLRAIYCHHFQSQNKKDFMLLFIYDFSKRYRTFKIFMDGRKCPAAMSIAYSNAFHHFRSAPEGNKKNFKYDLDYEKLF